MRVMAAGIWTENPLLKPKVPSGIGGGPGCLVAERITGEESPCGLVRKISKEEALMVSATTGLSVMKM